ncbi:MAG: DNA polymerase IV [Clostridia bacterium]|nr:DNA polymerase IV [Clostridia bacterium]
MAERLIFHVDVNSAFLSWEAAKRVAEGGEDLRLIPSAVGGDADKRTGVILAKSIPAKKYGVKTGEAVAAALRKCPNLTLVKSDFRLYVRCSRAFTDICRRYTPAIEKFSIDECFLDMTGGELLFPNPVETARALKDAIRDELGFTVNVGIAHNKVLAKMASDFEKPDRVHTLFEDEIPGKLWPLPVGELYAVGEATAARLEKACIRTIGQLAQTDLAILQSLVGVKLGRLLHDYANGIDDSPVVTEPERAKGYSISTTLEQDVTDRGTAAKILLALADSVASRMRADDAKAYCVSTAIRSSSFKNRSHQQKLSEPTDITDEIYQKALRLFDELWDGRTPLRLLGISLTDIVYGGVGQMTLFPDERKERARQVDKAVDDIRRRFGSETIVRGTICQSAPDVGRKYKAQIENKQKENKERS